MAEEKDELNDEFQALADAAINGLYAQDQGKSIVAYHYTDEAGLRGIVEGAGDDGPCLWATHALYMNDPQELQYAVTFLEDLYMDEFGPRKWRDPLVPSRVLRLLRRDVDERGYGIFITAFSEHKDSLSQWRGYADGGRGYAIGFDVKLGDAPFPFEPFRPPELSAPSAVRCVYDKDEQRKAVLQFFAMLKRLDDHLAASADPERDFQTAAKAFLRLAVHYSVVLKHPAYKEEREVRLVMVTRRTDSGSGNVRFRAGPYGLTPYVVLRLTTGDKRICAKRVVIGPKQGSFTTAGLRLYLAAKGHPGAEVKASETPLR